MGITVMGGGLAAAILSGGSAVASVSEGIGQEMAGQNVFADLFSSLRGRLQEMDLSQAGGDETLNALLAQTLAGAAGDKAAITLLSATLPSLPDAESAQLASDLSQQMAADGKSTQTIRDILSQLHLGRDHSADKETPVDASLLKVPDASLSSQLPADPLVSQMAPEDALRLSKKALAEEKSAAIKNSDDPSVAAEDLLASLLFANPLPTNQPLETSTGRFVTARSDTPSEERGQILVDSASSRGISYGQAGSQVAAEPSLPEALPDTLSVANAALSAVDADSSLAASSTAYLPPLPKQTADTNPENMPADDTRQRAPLLRPAKFAASDLPPSQEAAKFDPLAAGITTPSASELEKSLAGRKNQIKDDVRSGNGILAQANANANATAGVFANAESAARYLARENAQTNQLSASENRAARDADLANFSTDRSAARSLSEAIAKAAQADANALSGAGGLALQVPVQESAQTNVAPSVENVRAFAHTLQGVQTSAAGASRALETSAAEQTRISASVYDQGSWSKQLGERVVWMNQNGYQKAELHLNPSHLGPLQISLSIGADQTVATFVSQHAEVRQAIQDGLPQLREMFTSAGISLGQTHVGTQSQESFQQQFQQQTGSSSTRFQGDPSILGGEVASGTASALPSSRQSRGTVDLFA